MQIIPFMQKGMNCILVTIALLSLSRFMFFNIATSGVVEGALGLTKEDKTTRGVTTGVAPLDVVVPKKVVVYCDKLHKKRA